MDCMDDVSKLSLKAIALRIRELYPAHDELSNVVKDLEKKGKVPDKLVGDLKGLLASYESESMALNKVRLTKSGKKKVIKAE